MFHFEHKKALQKDIQMKNTGVLHSLKILENFALKKFEKLLKKIGKVRI